MHWNPEQWMEIPNELQNIPHWMVCGVDKAPFSVNGTTLPGGHTNPDNWSSFGKAHFYASQYPGRVWPGFCLSSSDPYAIIDVDNKQGLPLHAERIQAAQEMDTYIEVSVSGQGIHVVLLGDIGGGCRHENIEVYSQDRFILMTGDTLKKLPIGHDDHNLQYLVQWCGGVHHDLPDEPDGPSVDDMWLYEQLCNSKYHDKFLKLISSEWVYEWGDDPSVADFAFACMLAEFTTSNQQIWNIFSKLPLGQRLKDGKPRHPNSANFMANACRKARALANKQIGERAVSSEALQTMLNNTFNNVQHSNGNVVYPQQFQRQFPRQLPALNPFVNTFFGIDELLSRPPVKWVIKDMLQQGKTAILYGWSGVGKTFLVLDMMEAIATGRKWLNLRTTPMPVRYFSLEGVQGLQQRVLAWERQNARQYPRDNRVEISEQGVDLVKDWKLIADALKDLNGVIIIDTLAQAMGGRSETKSEDMQPITDAAKYLSIATNSAVIVVHHSTKPDAKTGETTGYPRGWGGLYANFDADIEIRETDDEMGRELFAEKVKDGVSKWSRQFTLNAHIVGMDEYNEPISSLAVAFESGLESAVDATEDAKPWEHSQEAPRRGRTKKSNPRTHKDDAPMNGAKSERAFRTSENEVKLADAWKGLKAQHGEWVPMWALEKWATEYFAGTRDNNKVASLGRVLEKWDSLKRIEVKPDGNGSQLYRLK